MLEPFLENDFSLSVPSSYTYLEAPLVVPERGPAPERSPVLARFEAGPGRPGVISVLTRKAQAFKQTLLQVRRAAAHALTCVHANVLLCALHLRTEHGAHPHPSRSVHAPHASSHHIPASLAPRLLPGRPGL